jgi:hypothetical protein
MTVGPSYESVGYVRYLSDNRDRVRFSGLNDH